MSAGDVHQRWLAVHEKPVEREPYAAEAWAVAVEIRALACDVRRWLDPDLGPRSGAKHLHPVVAAKVARSIGRELPEAAEELLARLDAWQCVMRAGHDPRAEAAEVETSLDRLLMVHGLLNPEQQRPELRVLPREAREEDGSAVAEMERQARAEWIDKATAARFLGVEVRAFEGYAKRPEFPSARLDGRRNLYSVLEVAAWAQREQRVMHPETLPEGTRKRLVSRIPADASPAPEAHAYAQGLRKRRKR